MGTDTAKALLEHMFYNCKIDLKEGENAFWEPSTPFRKRIRSPAGMAQGNALNRENSKIDLPS